MIGIIVAVAVLAGGAAAFFFVRQGGRAPSAGTVRSEVERLIANPQVKVTSVTPTITPLTPGSAKVSYVAEAEVSEALYEAVDSAPLLREQLRVDAIAWQKARKTLSGKTAPRIIELAGLKDADQTLLLTIFLREATPKGTKLAYSGDLRATKGDKGWTFVSERLTRTSGEERGKARGEFGAMTTVVSDQAEMDKLRTLAASQTDLPAKVEQGRQAFLRERQAEQEKVIGQLLEMIKPGTVFSGTYKVGSGVASKIFLEFTNVSASSKRVAALLRNDGGWTDKRQMTGAFTFDPDDETLAVTLDSPARMALAQAGPVLSDEEALRFVLQLTGERLKARDERVEVDLTRMSDSDVADERRRLESPALAVRDATVAGKIYRGTIKPKGGGESFDYLLRFNRQDPEAGSLVATLEPTERESWRRTYHGAIKGNRYRSQEPALLLESKAGQVVRGADEHQPAGLQRDSFFFLEWVGGEFRGEGEDFTYEFSPLSESDIAKLEAAVAERSKAQLSTIKADTAYSGVARNDTKGLTEKVRIRFTQVSDRGDDIAAVFESIEHSGVSREFHGSLQTAERRLVLKTINRGRAGVGSRLGLKFPPFVRSGDFSVGLNVTAEGLTGEVVDEGWTLNIPFSGSVEVAAEPPAPPAADFPEAPGAYAWTGNSWQSLPRNNGKSGSKNPIKAISSLFSSITKSSAPSSSGDVTFTGGDFVPSVDGKNVRVIYVGSIRSTSGSSALIEMAPTSRDSEGTRRAAGFHDHRINAPVERVNDNVVELTSSDGVSPGSYAVGVNDEFFELNVE